MLVAAGGAVAAAAVGLAVAAAAAAVAVAVAPPLGLDDSSSAVAAAATPLIIGTSPDFWNQIPSAGPTYSATLGTKLIFRYSAYHNVTSSVEGSIRQLRLQRSDELAGENKAAAG